MQKKQLIIIGGILLTVAAFMIIKIIDSSTNIERNTNDTIPASIFPTGDGALNNPVSNDVLVHIKTQEGEVVMNDPRKIKQAQELGSGIYSLTQVEANTTRTFDIVFNEENGSFAVGLTKEPIAKARLDAENYLRQQLNISQKDMCQLNIFVGVPYDINTFYSGQNLGLSFCKNSVSLK